MDYKKKYEEALERAKVVNSGTADYNIVTEIFPELKESKDERIRKALKSFFDSEISDYGNVEWRNGIRYGEIVAWLEKQGEQKTNENGTVVEIKGKTTCKSCKKRWDDGHFSFPDCWDGHKDENRKEGKNCPYYQFDTDIL